MIDEETLAENPYSEKRSFIAQREAFEAGAKAERKKMIEWFEENGAHFCKDEWEAINHKGFYELEWEKFEALLKLKEEG